jgi:K+-sensing histidine kinase KdpD
MRYISLGVMFYMLAALIWWTILLSNYNAQVYTLQVSKVNSISVPVTIESAESALKKYEKNKAMIIGEGFVFGISLIIGTYFIQRSYNNQIETNLRQKNFLLSISHELKSPLAAIKLNIDTLLKRKNIEADQREQLYQDMAFENNRLDKLISNLLLAAKLNKTYQYNFEKTDIVPIIKSVVKNIEVLYPKIKCSFDFEDTLVLDVDKEAIYSLIYNITENAAKYTPNYQGVILIKPNQNLKEISIDIADQGIGIDPRERTKIFDQFYRIGQEETRQSKGTGLGLFIAQQIIIAHKGKIIISDNKPNGSIFSLTIPKTV